MGVRDSGPSADCKHACQTINNAELECMDCGAVVSRDDVSADEAWRPIAEAWDEAVDAGALALSAIGFDADDDSEVSPRAIARRVLEATGWSPPAHTHSRVLDQIVAAAKWVIQDMNHLVNHGGIGTHKPCLDALAEAVMAAAGSARLACIHSYWTEVDAEGNCVECGGYRQGRGPSDNPESRT